MKYWAEAKRYAQLAWAWMRDNAVWLFLMLVGATVGAKLYRDKRSAVASVKAAYEIEAAKAAMAALKARRDELVTLDTQLVSHDQKLVDKVEVIEAAINEKKRRIVELHTGAPNLQELSDVEVDALFRAAGL